MGEKTDRGEGRRGSCVVCGSSSSSAFALEGNGFNKTEVKKLKHIYNVVQMCA